MAALTTCPLEIIESIMDVLATEDDPLLSSIKACSLVSRRLLPRARRYIFSSITIDGECYNPALSRQKFVRLIGQTPEIAHYVTSLNYSVTRSDTAIVGLATALSSLVRLENLTVSAWPATWKDLPLREVILDLMHLPTLSHFSLNNSDGFLLSDLALCTGLKSLEINNAAFIERGSDNVIYQEQPPRLERYIGENSHFPSGDLLTLLCTTRHTNGKPVVDISELKTISLHVKQTDLDAIKTCFTFCTQLKDVHLHESEQLLATTGFAKLFLHSIQTLQHIHMEFRIWQYEDLFLWLASEFASLTGRNIIESIKISITVHLDANHAGSNEWSMLDRIFDHGWGKLKTFSIDIKVQHDVGDPSKCVDDLVRNMLKLPEIQLGGLARNEDILFDFEVSTVAFEVIE